MTTPTQPTTPPQPGSKAGDGAPDKGGYKATLNLPKTTFPMKANLVQNEPASIKRWAAMGLYDRIREARKGSPRYLFHDGPPYANGSLHLGHLLNRCLKDFVVRTRTMAGLDCPYIPGWDCHGLPIEHKVMSDLVEAGKADKLRTLTEDQRRMAVRRECQKHAEKFVKLHIEQMTRLLTLADFEHPYKTMSPEYEAATLEVLASLMEQGLVYRALKPVHWSVANETALAEAELEYFDREDTSVYVDFEAADASAVYEAFGLRNDEHAEDAGADGEDQEVEEEPPGARPTQSPCFMIWTTTPWTLPANLAIAVNPRLSYALVRIDGNVTVVATEAVERLARGAKAGDVAVLASVPGDRLVGLRYRHPFADARSLVRASDASASGFTETRTIPDPIYTVVAAEYVTLEDGTGLVHTAPGHGTEDYMTGQRVGLPIYCPVQADGTYDTSVPDWLRGKDIWKANDDIVRRLRESGHLFFEHKFTHSYPHDWRSKTPVIFRCTEQWFVGVDEPMKGDGRTLRGAALEAVAPPAEPTFDPPLPSDTPIGGTALRPRAGIRFVPDWGRNRLRGMLESRPDWCISRQRAWGLPIPAFFLPDGSAFMTPASVRAVARLVGEKGSDCWFTGTTEDLLGRYDPAEDPHAPAVLKGRDPSHARATLKKGPDILDVWFESGSSWNAVMRRRSGGADFPADLYLEGSDQHRGWFQTSLLPALGVMGRPPYRTILTHGFMVDKDGRKLSKSQGDTLEDLFKDYGVDVLRWWVSSLSYENDMKIGREFYDLAGESYRKIRNTLRFMLSNLDDFAPPTPPTPPTGEGRPGHRVDLKAISPTSLDAWALAEYERVARTVTEAYEAFDFQSAHKALYAFCNDTLSATYLAAIKDRLYCDRPDSPRRRRTQTTLWNLTDGLSRLLAPILCHTADEAHRALWKAEPTDTRRCVHLVPFIASFGVSRDPAWTRVFGLREKAMRALERAKTELGVENPLDAGLTLPDPDGSLSRFERADLADLFGVSRVRLDAAAPEPIVIDLRQEPRCDRSWKRDGTVKRRGDGGMLSDRDAEAVGVT